GAVSCGRRGQAFCQCCGARPIGGQIAVILFEFRARFFAGLSPHKFTSNGPPIIIPKSNTRCPGSHVRTLSERLPWCHDATKCSWIDAYDFASDEMIASLEYAVQVLNIPLIMVLGHEACGAVDATIKSVKDGSTLPGHLPS